MPKEVFGKDYQFLERKELLTFEEITRLARIFRGLGIEKIRLTGGEPLVRRNLEQLIAMLAAIPGLDLTLTTNGSLPRAQGAGAEGRGPASASRSASTRSTTRCSAHERRRLPGREGARRHRRRRGGGLDPGQDQHGGQARRERGEHPADGALLPRHAATSCASSSTWTSATPTAGAWTTSSPRARSSSTISRRDAARAGRCQLHGRSRRALALPRRHRRDRRHRVGHAGVLPRLHARAALHRRQALHLSLRHAAATTCARCCAPAPRDDEIAARDRGDLDAARRPLLRDPQLADGAARRRSRCPTSAAERDDDPKLIPRHPPAHLRSRGAERARRSAADADRGRASADALRRQARDRHADDARPGARSARDRLSAQPAAGALARRDRRSAGRLGNRRGRRHDAHAARRASTRRWRSAPSRPAAARARCSAI